MSRLEELIDWFTYGFVYNWVTDNQAKALVKEHLDRIVQAVRDEEFAKYTASQLVPVYKTPQYTTEKTPYTLDCAYRRDNATRSCTGCPAKDTRYCP